MAWHWLLVSAERPTDAFAVADLQTLEGDSAGFIAAWRRGESRRPPGALGVDVRAVDPSGESAWVSLALAPLGLRFLFDDPAVSWALKRVLAGPRVRAVSTLTRDSATIGGALTAYDFCPGTSQSDDPFARLFPTRVLRVGPGFVARMGAPTGPGIQRYAGSPWPWNTFSTVAH
jgi:hypothetical protein